MIKHVARRSRNVPDRRLMHPKREWLIGLGLFTLVLVVSGIVSAQRFAYFSHIETHLEATELNVVTYKTGAMNDVIRQYDERTVRFQQLRNGIAPRTPDPIVIENQGADDTATSSDAVATTSTETIESEETTEDPESGGLDVE